MVGTPVAAQAPKEFRERRNAGQREPVVVRVGDAGLLADAARQIG